MPRINIVYFARLREELNCSEETLELTLESCSVGQLKERLAEREGAWQQVFTEFQVLVAVNKTMATVDTIILAGDEVGFFPPVTGG